MTTSNPHSPFRAVSASIDIPDSAYERAEARYNDLGEWLGREESSVREYDPEVFPQGSFLLGTVTHPSTGSGEYDLDLGVKLRRGVSKDTHTQEELKSMVGKELEAYRRARGIQTSLDEKRRCWRLHYQDGLTFHLDIVPCIPEDEKRRGVIKEALLKAEVNESLAEEVSQLTVSITDTDRDNYHMLSGDWNVSNPQGYGRWFESRVRLVDQTVLMTEKRAEVQELPTHKLKAPLQRCIQILKLHRDNMFKNDSDRAPISIIITTLAARAYNGAEEIGEALQHIVSAMGDHVKRSTPRVPNPVRPDEDFSDKWDTPEGKDLGLEQSFWTWLRQVQVDVKRILRTMDADAFVKTVDSALGIRLTEDAVHQHTRFGPHQGDGISPNASWRSRTQRPTPSKTHIQTPPKPWTSY